MSEAREQFGETLRDIDARLARLESAIGRIDAAIPLINQIAGALPHLATTGDLMAVKLITMIGETKVELEKKPGKGFLVGMAAILIAAYAVGLATLALLPVIARL